MEGPSGSRAPYWAAAAAVTAIAVLVIVVLFVVSPFHRPEPSGDHNTVSPGATATGSPSASPSTEPSGQPFTCGGTQDYIPNAGSPTPPPAVYISGLHTTREGAHDRLTIDLANGIPPEVKISSVAGTTYTLSPSGITTTVKGTNSVLVVIHGADLHTRYSGSTDITTGFPALAEVKRIEDFEGVVQLALGVNGAPCYRASFLTNPTRLVVDVQAA